MKTNQHPYNPWSLVAILCAFGLCPLFSIASIFAGSRAIIEIKARGDSRGLLLAKIAVVVGSLVTGLWVGGAVWWNMNVRSNINHGPIQAIIDGQSGDIEAFNTIFIHGEDATATTFIDEFTKRYGIIISGHLNPDPEASEIDASQLLFGLVPIEATMSYLLVNKEGVSVPITANYEMFQQEESGNRFVNCFTWIRINAHEGGDLVYPVVSGNP